MKGSRWFHFAKKINSPRLRLFCFPYAGGGIRTYLPWAAALEPDIEVIAVQPPGRGSFMDTTAFDNMTDLVAALYPQILPLLDRPYVLFGHSLGSRVAFALLEQLQQQQQPLPISFVASGSNSPGFVRTKATTYHLADAQFLAELQRMNGTPAEVLANHELMALLLPLLRNDFKIAETYRYTGHSKFPCDLHVLGGHADADVPVATLSDWGNFFQRTPQVHTFSDGHFFIESQQSEVLSLIRSLSQGWLAMSAPQHKQAGLGCMPV